MRSLQQYSRGSIYSSARHKIAQREILNWFLMRNWKSKSIREGTHSFAICRMHGSLIGKITLLLRSVPFQPWLERTKSISSKGLLSVWASAGVASPQIYQIWKFDVFHNTRAHAHKGESRLLAKYIKKKSGVVWINLSGPQTIDIADPKWMACGVRLELRVGCPRRFLLLAPPAALTEIKLDYILCWSFFPRALCRRIVRPTQPGLSERVGAKLQLLAHQWCQIRSKRESLFSLSNRRALWNGTARTRLLGFSQSASDRTLFLLQTFVGCLCFSNKKVIKFKWWIKKLNIAFRQECRTGFNWFGQKTYATYKVF